MLTIILGFQTWITETVKDPAILVAFGIIIFTSVVFPLAVAYAFRLWGRITRAWNEERIEKLKGEKLAKEGMAGSFNSKVLKDLYHISKKQELHSEFESESEENDKDKKPEKEVPSLGPYLHAKFKPLLKKEGGQKTPTDSQHSTPDICTQLLMGKKKKSQEEEDAVQAIKNLSENGLHGKLATAQLRARTHKMEECMTDEEKQKERQIKQEQLNSIFIMMQAQGEKFGVHDKDELEEQLKLYSV